MERRQGRILANYVQAHIKKKAKNVEKKFVIYSSSKSGLVSGPVPKLVAVDHRFAILGHHDIVDTVECRIVRVVR